MHAALLGAVVARLRTSKEITPVTLRFSKEEMARAVGQVLSVERDDSGVFVVALKAQPVEASINFH